MNERHMAWRRVVSVGVASGIATPALSASLGYYDQYRRDRLPANLIQGQRDFFGGEFVFCRNMPARFVTG